MAAVELKRQSVYAEDESAVDWPRADVPVLGGQVMIEHQEVNGDYVFSASSAHIVYTPGFAALFQNNTVVITSVVLESMQMVHKAFRHPDYLQKFFYEESEFSGSEEYWAIHDGEHITFLLPDEY